MAQGSGPGRYFRFRTEVGVTSGTESLERRQTLDGVQNPFWREALLKMQENTLALLKAVEGKAVIEQTPDVPVEKLFDAIIAPYKGKVILVDFWNTWCAPCRMAIKANEPLKDGELKSDNLVWIYIANQTSPLVKYKEMIPGTSRASTASATTSATTGR